MSLFPTLKLNARLAAVTGIVLVSTIAKAEDITLDDIAIDEQRYYRPTITNSSWEELAAQGARYDSPFKVSLFTPKNGEDSARLWSQTKSVAAYGVGVAGAMTLLPTSITNWDKSDDRLMQKWWDNVRSGPVWDRDDFAINYIGHPYFGGVYYQAARKSGYRQWDAFIYSFMMSTFYWEYGVEAFAETPSIQDIVVTPVLGWVYGEWAYNKEQQILARGGTVWGSEGMGSTARFFLDPIDSIGRGINQLFGQDVVRAGTGYISISEQELNNGLTDKQVKLQLSYSIGGGHTESNISRYSYQQSYQGQTGDPVSYSIVGISAGTSMLQPSSAWGLESGWAPTISLGLYFTPSLSTRLSYARADLKQHHSQQSVTFEQYSLDTQYYFNTEQSLRPYLTAGFGESMREKDLSQKAFQVNLGAGLHYQVAANWAVQLNWQQHYSGKHKQSDQQLNAQIVYRFGKGAGN